MHSVELGGLHLQLDESPNEVGAVVCVTHDVVAGGRVVGRIDRSGVVVSLGEGHGGLVTCGHRVRRFDFDSGVSARIGLEELWRRRNVRIRLG